MFFSNCVQAIADSDKGFSILQPGSSVATALSEGEAKKKHVIILEILGDQWRTFKFPLRTVRPFAFDQVLLNCTSTLLCQVSHALPARLHAIRQCANVLAWKPGTCD
jgi:double-strand break repair protein MRE11